ncbi:MAG: GNAT family N-acetyltransferase [Nocardioidaceae bacterium]|nr:GNAT family N-acetyltransferase [Nocardioidaceae bacterium]
MDAATSLRTERLILRRWRASDREPFAAMNADPVVMEHFPSVRSRAESDDLVDRVEARFDRLGWGLWALERLDDGAFLGFTGLHPMPAGTPDPEGTEVGWRLARHAWGHGYASEAARAALAHGFDVVGLDHVDSITAVTNTRSQAVMRRLGMRLAAEFDHPALDAGSPLRPHLMYRLDRP